MSDPSRPELEICEADGVIHVAFQHAVRLDEESITAVGEQLFKLADEVGGKTIRFDLGCVQFISSSGLGKLISMDRKMKAAGGKLILCNVDAQIYQVFEITRLNELFHIEPR